MKYERCSHDMRVYALVRRKRMLPQQVLECAEMVSGTLWCVQKWDPACFSACEK
ncbi:MAG: hypothetical protein IJH41_00805 [Eubacterium sp.]|nr:hypothetical protein [Eubacterium sp.]